MQIRASVKVRLEVTKICNIPASYRLASRDTDRYMKKLFRKKFGKLMNAKKRKKHINSQNKIWTLLVH